jgi:hypothetical protein
VCSNKNTRCVNSSDVPNLLKRGATLGACGTSTGAAAFAAQDTDKDSQLTSLPNPAVGQTSVSFTLPEAGSFRLEVLNMQGSVVAVLGEGTGKAGQRFSYEFKKGNLKGDLYIAHLVTGSGNKFTRIELKD